jgi:hypothetical protein
MERRSGRFGEVIAYIEVQSTYLKYFPLFTPRNCGLWN